MSVFRRKRAQLLAAGLGIVALAGVLLAVLPASATPVNSYIKPRSVAKNIMPWDVATGGQSDDCAVFYPNGGGPAYQYRIANPKSKTYSTTINGRTVTFTVTMNPPNLVPALPAYTNDKYVSISATGAAIVDIGIKGGTDTARYNYTGLTPPGGAIPADGANANYGSISGDTYLRAPAQTANANGIPTQL